MFIPKGTVCLQNMRVINSEPDVFGRDATEFVPARYLDESRQVRVLNGREEGHMAFGFGSGYALGGTSQKARWRLTLRRCFGSCDSSALRVRGVSWTCVLLPVVALLLVQSLLSARRSLGSQRLRAC
ncbi:hypothetical protein EI94DRAFT_1753063 [Lactarius quietus]|nr:hypothetical protein EI94DRAFT_1753063 [Lactarius quietus]